jgi:serine/threonine protein kinase
VCFASLSELHQANGAKQLSFEKLRLCSLHFEVCICRWFIGIARAVKYLHACKPPIVHRDLKPENVMLTTHDKSAAEAKILDLGLHMRRKGTSMPTDEGSYYGGNLYDASVQNGSIGGGVAGKLASQTKKLSQAICRAGVCYPHINGLVKREAGCPIFLVCGIVKCTSMTIILCMYLAHWLLAAEREGGSHRFLVTPCVNTCTIPALACKVVSVA